MGKASWLLALSFLALLNINCSRNLEAYSKYDKKYEKYEKIVGQQILDIIEQVRIRAGIDREVVVYSSKDKSDSGIYIGGMGKGQDDKIRIILHRDVFRCSSEAISGYLAHELGHYLAGHSMGWDYLTESDKEFKQAEANAQAISLVGKDAVNSFLICQGFPKDLAMKSVQDAEKLLKETK